MSDRQVQRPLSDAAEIDVPSAAGTNSVSRNKILLGVLAALFVVVSVPLLFRADMQLVAANSALKCYDSAGKYEPCATRVSASASQSISRTMKVHLPAGWITTALYRPESWKTPAVDQAENFAISAPAGRRSAMPRKHLASACHRHLIPCFFSALRRGVTHFASAAAAQSRPVREHL